MNFRNLEFFLLDNNEELSLLISKILENKGAYVSLFTDELQTLEEIKRIFPHLLILNLKDCKVNCTEFLIKRGEWLKSYGIKIIALSEDDPEEIISMYSQYGLNDVVPFPVKSSELIKSIRKVFHQTSTDFCAINKSEELDIELQGEITKFNEFEFVLTAPVRLCQNGDYVVRSDFLENEGFGFIKLVSNGISFYNESGLYDNRLNITGANDAFIKKIQKLKKLRNKN